jgi:hypothetical protein
MDTAELFGMTVVFGEPKTDGCLECVGCLIDEPSSTFRWWENNVLTMRGNCCKKPGDTK